MECGLPVPALLARVHHLALQLVGRRAASYSRTWYPMWAFQKAQSSGKEERWPPPQLQSPRTTWGPGVSASSTPGQKDMPTLTLPLVSSYDWGNPLVPMNAKARDCSPSLIHKIMQYLSLKCLRWKVVK